MNYFLKRLLLMVPTFFCVLCISFFLIHLTPGGPVDSIIMSMRKNSSKTGMVSQRNLISVEQVKEIEKEYGLDLPIHERFGKWMRKVGQLDFGNSSTYGRPVIEVIKERLPVSIQFGLSSFILGYIITIFLGLLMGYFRHGLMDRTIKLALIISSSIPALLVSIILILGFASDYGFNVFPLAYLTSDDYDSFSTLEKIADRARHFILPLTSYMLGSFTVGTLILRSKILEEYHQEYVRTAVAKGLSAKDVLVKHILKNAVFPLIAGLGGVIGVFLSGSVLVETIFQLPGIGLLSYEATLRRDYNLLMALILFSSLFLMLGNLISDFALKIFDPRVDFKKAI